MKIKFTADSTCDAGAEFLARYPLELIPLTVELDGKYYKDGVDITPELIIDTVNRGSDLPKTSAINVEETRSMFERVLQDCDAIIHFDIGSDFSSCYQNASIAAEGLPVYCVDTRNLSCGGTILIALAQDMAEAGMEAEAIVEKLNEIIPKVDMSFVVDRLDFLHKGGRCSMIAMLGANVLHLRPSIEVNDSAMTVSKKYRGTYERCLKAYLKDRLADKASIDDSILYIIHTSMNEQALSEIREYILKDFPFKRVFTTQAGSTITSHCGANTFGICVIHK